MRNVTDGPKGDRPREQRNLTPREIVTELERYIVGQDNAKRSVAIAIRNRWRRQRLPDGMREEVAPKNILMVGPTGVGKTEIARRLARLTGAPFIKVEATKYTEVGYYGRDVESMVRELVENAIGLVRERERRKVEKEARVRLIVRDMLDLLGDHRSRNFYIMVARKVLDVHRSPQLIYRALSETKAEALAGNIRRSKGAYFTALIKRYLAEDGINLADR